MCMHSTRGCTSTNYNNTLHTDDQQLLISRYVYADGSLHTLAMVHDLHCGTKRWYKKMV